MATHLQHAWYGSVLVTPAMVVITAFVVTSTGYLIKVNYLMHGTVMYRTSGIESVWLHHWLCVTAEPKIPLLPAIGGTQDNNYSLQLCTRVLECTRVCAWL